jgi:hypothetical protein
MTTSADLVREMIDEMAARVWAQGGNLLDGCSERVEALWMEIDAHLRAADLCELTGKLDRMTTHLDRVNRLLDKILDELPEDDE